MLAAITDAMAIGILSRVVGLQRRVGHGGARLDIEPWGASSGQRVTVVDEGAARAIATSSHGLEIPRTSRVEAIPVLRVGRDAWLHGRASGRLGLLIRYSGTGWKFDGWAPSGERHGERVNIPLPSP
jgi:hypothetical protein